ncbi:cache domain-containing protein [Marinomonas ostreistagni]|uniref:cache domain-containing protein n=1 Tax=Marinomonas ostreistagni TaxID=359209 RepID=UPI00194FDFAC|nr:cache domain-containing protein [Marinomonas ostreistagni]
MASKRWRQYLDSLRGRMVALTLFPLLLVLPGVILLAYLWSNEVGYRQLLMKANTDLAVAHETFLNTQEQYLVRLSLSANDYRFRADLREQLASPEATKVDNLQQRLALATELDFVRILSPAGCAIAQQDCFYPSSPLLTRAQLEGPSSGVEVFSQTTLERLDPALAKRAAIPPLTGADASAIEQRGMLLHFVYPVTGEHGQILAYLAAGLLMNANHAFVDQISNTVYGPGSLPEQGLGTVTLFLDNVRISTNVPHPSAQQQRAIGTTVSDQVQQQVLLQGERWLDRAFVVNDWYVSAYEPVTDVNGERIGMLYAGFLEAPFMSSLYHWLELLLWLFAAVLVVCITLAILGARSLAKPFEIMTSVMDRIRDGERLQIPSLNTTAEVHQLAEHFNDMQSQLDQQRDEILSAAQQLEHKVAQRTQALEQKTQELQQHITLLNRTREQLVEQGKLAALGELTAGVAHEINNPTAVILGYMDILMDELGDQVTPEIQHDADIIIAQVARIRTIIDDLLKLAKQDPNTHQLAAIDVGPIIENTQALVQHELSRRRISLRLDLRADQLALADSAQLQQVLINLIMNAANAIDNDGTITLRSRNHRLGGVRVLVADNGCGMTPTQKKRIFDPFYTTSSQGTGLGLAISKRLLDQARATLKVRSKVAVGTLFAITLQGGSK